ncbi:MAG: phosphopentomutase, partial [Oscillospiraceae bacterium]
KSDKFDCPNLTNLGLFNIDGVTCKPPVSNPVASFARLREQSMGKDTTIGHWEIAGIISPTALPTYPNGFPDDIIKKFEALSDHKAVCNMPYSGTTVLQDYGEHHLKTGDLIVYTSADSVFQIAAHEDIVSIPELYDICQKTRDMLTESGVHAVGRVIARPFIGTDKTNFERTPNRHDYSLKPPKKTMLDYLLDAKKDTIGVGKIFDIFDGVGVSEKFRTKSNSNGMEVTMELADRDFDGLCFVNLVDFDMKYGHRNNVDGYAAASTEFDVQLAQFLPKLRPDDVLIITADHGCDPGYTKTTDHSREYVPMLICGDKIKSGVDLKTRDSFADIAATVCDYLDVSADIAGTSFLSAVLK